MTPGCRCASCEITWPIFWSAFYRCYWASWAAVGSHRTIAVEHLKAATEALVARSHMLSRVPCALS